MAFLDDDYYKDWEHDNTHNTISPKYDNALKRYILPIEDIVDNLNKSGYPIDGNIVYVPDGQGGTKPLPEKLNDMLFNSSNLYRLEMISTSGTIINNPNFKSVLKVILYKNNIDITNEILPRYFKWTRTSGYTEEDQKADAEWNLRWADGAREIPITAEDVNRNADFKCQFIDPSKEVQYVKRTYDEYVKLTNFKRDLNKVKQSEE